MALIVISDPTYFKGESQLINLLFATGMPVFHLRKPGTDLLTYKKLIDEIDNQYHDRVALHQFHELSATFPLIRRFHYPEQLRKTDFRQGLNAGCENMNSYTFSTSVHHTNDLKTLKNFDYTFYGPVFTSISKPGYTGLSKANLVLPNQNRPVKIIALGGITCKNILEIKQMGFDGMAVLGNIWQNRTLAIENLKNLLINYKLNFN